MAIGLIPTNDSMQRHRCHIFTTGHVVWRLTLSLVFLHTFGTLNLTPIAAQGTGELAEMDRLEQRGDELAVQGDPEGASQNFGKAAMMADILRQAEQDSSRQTLFQAAALQYRAQERGLRSLALFDRTGGQPPAPAGVCHYLSQATQKLLESKVLLESTATTSLGEMQARRESLGERQKEWKNIFEGLHQDFECPPVQGVVD